MKWIERFKWRKEEQMRQDAMREHYEAMKQEFIAERFKWGKEEQLRQAAARERLFPAKQLVPGKSFTLPEALRILAVAEPLTLTEDDRKFLRTMRISA